MNDELYFFSSCHSVFLDFSFLLGLVPGAGLEPAHLSEGGVFRFNLMKFA